MADAKKCDICGKYYDKLYFDNTTLVKKDVWNTHITDICPECTDLIESFIESIKEGSLAVGLLDYRVSVYGEDKLSFMLKQRGDKNGETKE